MSAFVVGIRGDAGIHAAKLSLFLPSNGSDKPIQQPNRLPSDTELGSERLAYKFSAPESLPSLPSFATENSAFSPGRWGAIARSKKSACCPWRSRCLAVRRVESRDVPIQILVLMVRPPTCSTQFVLVVTSTVCARLGVEAA